MRSNQWILKEISPQYSLKGLMLKLKFQYFSHLMWRTKSMEKTLMLGKIEGGKKRGQKRMASTLWWTWAWVHSRSSWCIGKPGVLKSMGLQRVGHEWETELTSFVYVPEWAGRRGASLCSGGLSSEATVPWTLHVSDTHVPMALILQLLIPWRKSGNLPVHFNSVTQSCPNLCDPMDCSMPGFPVHHQLPKLAQTHVHWVSDAIQPSHPLLSPSPSAFNLSLIRVFSSESVLCIRWPKYWVSASASVLLMKIQDCFPLGLTGLISLQSRDSEESSPPSQFRSINSLALSFLYGTTLTSTPWLLGKP